MVLNNTTEIITISHQKGGVGKSTLLWNLIINYSKERKIYVIDLDVQKTITYSLLVRKNNNLDTKNIILLDPKNKDEMLNLMKGLKGEDKLFIDSGGYDSDMNRLAISASTILLTPVSTKFYEVLGLKEYERILAEISNDIGRVLVTNVILNKIHHNTKALEDIVNHVSKSKYFNLMETIIRDRADYANSPSEGMNVCEFNEKGAAALDIKELTSELNSIIRS